MRVTDSILTATAFGVGCLAFEYKDRRSRFTLEDWARDVQESLNSLPSVKNVSIAIPPVVDEKITLVAMNRDEVEDTPNKRWFDPEPVGTKISFDIQVPYRFHKKYALGRPTDSVGEEFRVDLEYGYDAPVAIVTCLADSASQDDSQGSTAVVLVRKFLADQLNNSAALSKLSVVGPSPFHADFLLQPGDAWGAPFIWEEVSREGYAHLVIEYSTELFLNATDAMSTLQRYLVQEFSVFYETVRRNYARMHKEYELFDLTSDLIQSSTAKGLRAWFRRVFRTSAKARELGLNALQANVAIDEDRQWANEQLNELEAQTFVLNVAKKETEDHARETFRNGVDNALSTVRFLENSRTKEFEVAVLGSSTLVGAIAGTIAAILAGG